MLMVRPSVNRVCRNTGSPSARRERRQRAAASGPSALPSSAMRHSISLASGTPTRVSSSGRPYIAR